MSRTTTPREPTSQGRRRLALHGLIVAATVALGGGPARAQGPRPTGGLTQAAVLAGEWMLPVARAQAVTAVRQTLRALDLGLSSADDTTGMYRTRRTGYRPSWPGVDALWLTPFHTPTRAEFHVYVPPTEPARLVVGAILESDVVRVPLRGAKGKGESTYYSHRPLGEFLATAVAAALGVPLEPMAADPAERAAQAARLLPAGLRDACSVRPAPVVRVDGGTGPRPRALHTVRPVYPTPQVERGIVGLVTLRGELTEHGTLRAMEQVDGTKDANLIASAFGAAGLWRFSPAQVDGCPVRSPVTIEISFSLVR
jgi:TonB family protein